MSDFNKPITNPELLAAVERMNRENSRESREAVLDLVISSARFLSPVTISQAPAAGNKKGRTVKASATRSCTP